MSPLLVLVGPTASGKTALAVRLATALGGEVVNADSRQVYRGLDVGTGKPGPDERSLVPHHLFDAASPLETYSAARFREQALGVLAVVTARGRLPIVVGGTGLYVRALLRGLFAGPGRDEANHARLAAIAGRPGGLARLHRWLRRIDPEWALRIGPADRQRILRGLDVWLQTRVPMTAHVRAHEPEALPYRVLVLGLDRPRAELGARIDRRVDEMMASGFLAEVERLHVSPAFAASNAAKALGYRTLAALLRGELEREEAVARVKLETRQFAKRQRTWFRHDPDVQWLPAAEGDDPFQEAVARIHGRLFGAETPAPALAGLGSGLAASAAS